MKTMTYRGTNAVDSKCMIMMKISLVDLS